MTIPRAVPGDIDEVVRALEAADMAWPDDPAATITWLHRAAQIAGQAGHDERALELALAATEIAERKTSAVIPSARQHDESATTAELDVSTFGKPKTG